MFVVRLAEFGAWVGLPAIKASVAAPEASELLHSSGILLLVPEGGVPAMRGRPVWIPSPPPVAVFAVNRPAERKAVWGACRQPIPGWKQSGDDSPGIAPEASVFPMLFAALGCVDLRGLSWGTAQPD